MRDAPTEPVQVIDLNAWHHAIHHVTGEMAAVVGAIVCQPLSRE
jgi:hypothetical protein